MSISCTTLEDPLMHTRVSRVLLFFFISAPAASTASQRISLSPLLLHALCFFSLSSLSLIHFCSRRDWKHSPILLRHSPLPLCRINLQKMQQSRQESLCIAAA